MKRLTNNSDLSELIEQEKRALARECFNEMWDELTDEHLGPEMIAEECVEAALQRLVAERGEHVATKLISHFKQLDEMGLLPENRSLQ